MRSFFVALPHCLLAPSLTKAEEIPGLGNPPTSGTLAEEYTLPLTCEACSGACC
jgi:hypothetical protein